MKELDELEREIKKINTTARTRRKILLTDLMICFRRLRIDYCITPLGDFIEIESGGEWRFAANRWEVNWEHGLPLHKQNVDTIKFLYKKIMPIKRIK